MNSIKIAGIMGTAVQLYTQATNPGYLQTIYRDMAEGRYVHGTLKVVIPYVVPYIVSSINKRSMQKFYFEKIKDLESKIRALEDEKS
jgi:hypothetical protein